MTNEHYQTELERLSVLETEWTQSKADIQEIKLKLDELLHLKSKGLGAIWLITLLVGSGIIGFLNNIAHIFSKSHT